MGRQLAAVAVALAALAPAAAWSWGGAGHRWIAARALSQHTPVARTQLERLLALEPGATLPSVSTWADDTRTPDTAAWHYVNLSPDGPCRYEPARDCPQDQCVVGAIEFQRAILSSTVSDGERLVALKYLVHLVADVHQPLHAGWASDRGGNRYQVRFGGRGTNLHSVWDSGLIEQRADELATRLADPVPGAPGADEPIAPALWAEESCRIVMADDFYPAQRRVDADYARWAWPILYERLNRAARRLAALLNQTLTVAP